MSVATPSFRITGLSPQPFRHLFGLPDDALAAQGARRYVVDEMPGFPDRIEMRDLEPGETVLLVNHMHQPGASPYRSSHAVFVGEASAVPFDAVDRVPDVLRRRVLSLRGFDAADMIVDADLVDGQAIEGLIARLLDNPDITYIHAHYAKRGCYAGLIRRA